MIINKVSNNNGITDIAYSVLKEGGKEDEFTLRSGDIPLPKMLNTFLKLRDAVVELLELPSNDEEVKKITVTKVSFDYSGEDNRMGAVISGKRALKLSGGNMAVNTPHKFAYAGKKAENQVFGKAITDLLETLQEEAIKYVNGERSQGELFKKDKVEVTITASVPEDKPKKLGPKKKVRKILNNNGPEMDPGYAVKAKGKYLTIGGGYATRLTALISQTGVLQDSTVHEDMKEVGYAGNKIIFEVDGGLYQIHSAVVDHKVINNEELARNVIEELIEDMVNQPVLRFIPAANLGSNLIANMN